MVTYQSPLRCRPTTEQTCDNDNMALAHYRTAVVLFLIARSTMTFRLGPTGAFRFSPGLEKRLEKRIGF